MGWPVEQAAHGKVHAMPPGQPIGGKRVEGKQCSHPSPRGGCCDPVKQSAIANRPMWSLNSFPRLLAGFSCGALTPVGLSLLRLHGAAAVSYDACNRRQV